MTRQEKKREATTQPRSAGREFFGFASWWILKYEDYRKNFRTAGAACLGDPSPIRVFKKRLYCTTVRRNTLSLS